MLGGGRVCGRSMLERDVLCALLLTWGQEHCRQQHNSPWLSTAHQRTMLWRMKGRASAGMPCLAHHC
jgi:hypothetical protein